MEALWKHSKNETYYVPGRIVINLTARYNSSWGDSYPPNVFPNPGEEKCYECIKSHEAIRYSYYEEAQPEFGTNWQEYLPPRFQKRIFFPLLWDEDEMENWGRKWVLNALK